MGAISPSGLEAVPHLQWGSHLTHVFDGSDELRDLIVPYFKAGLENHERCLWVTGKAFSAAAARAALREAMPDLDRYEGAGQIEIADGDAWYTAGTPLNARELVAGLVQREQDALAAGYQGLRTHGNCAWVTEDQWPAFMDYEALVQETVRGRRMICMCGYGHGQVKGAAHMEVLERHDMAVRGSRPVAEPIVMPRAPADTALAEQKRTFDLAMLAADMGTWRYTLADNICVYDENAQRLYGLTAARFLHDEEGVKAKFHPDDMALMWARVKTALDPGGDARYDVEYRVKQLDGTWRWLSAWGLVEFEGEGPARRPVAIAGASRDLTKMKEAEELQRLLLNELNHRVKNTFATIQAITAQTLRSSADLPSARIAVDRRIQSLAQAHDLLTVRAWSGADLTEVVIRALDAFAPSQVKMTGKPLDISPKHALALSLALHELATNATKYGALSRAGGHVNVEWIVHGGTLHLDWEERGGPPVAPPTRRGFGSRLLEELVVRDLGGETRLNYDAAGVRCRISVAV